MNEFNLAQRLAALRIGAMMLRERYPTSNKCYAAVPDLYWSPDIYAVFIWPGAVRVTQRYTGKLIAQSLPGQPFDLDPSVHA